jgi:TonB-dependent receptor
MSTRCALLVIGTVLMVLGGIARPSAQTAGAPGVVEGQVLDSSTGEPLPGAQVTIEGTVVVASTDRAGRFVLAGVPAGARVLVVNYLGRSEKRIPISVTAGRAITERVRMEAGGPSFEEQVTVTADYIRDADARALNQQRTAPNITNVVSADQIGQFPDPNAVEAVQRIPGVSIQRDQGEGRYIIIRGTEPRLNSVLINGERVPSPDGELRSVAADVIPADLLQSIELTKALTPDVDADAIGGAVNLVMKQPPQEPLVLATVAGGYNSLMDDAGQFLGGFTWGGRLLDGKLGVIGSGSAMNAHRGSDNFEPAYDDGDLEELGVRDYTINRKRAGVNWALDFRQSASTNYYLRGVWNYFSDYEYRRELFYAVGDNEIARNLKDRFESERIASVSAGGEHVLRGGAVLDYRITGSYADNDRPDEYNTSFAQEDVEFAPNVSPGAIDPDNIQANPLNEDLSAFALAEQELSDNFNRERDFVGAINMRLPLPARDGFAGFVKFGGKFRNKQKDQDDNARVSEPEDDIFLADYTDSGFDPGNFLDGRYTPGPFVDPAAAKAFTLRLPFETAFDFETDAADFNARENVSAVYGMAELFLGPKLMVLSGLRLEATSLDYTGYEVTFDEDGEYAATRSLEGSESYYQLLPAVHVRYALQPNTNLRAAVTRSLARPNYYDLVPYELIVNEDLEIERGNAALEPTTSWNLDFMAEHYLQSVGVLSAGVFYKRLSNIIFPFTFSEDRDGDEFRVLQPRNGDNGTLYGIELAAQAPLRFLPGPFNGLGVYANYTFTDSSTRLPDRIADSTLPGQSSHVGNLSVWYEKFGLSARASVNFHGKYIDQVGEDAGTDIYYDDHRQVDISVSQAVTKNIRLFADFVNLSDAPLRYYEGFSTRPIQEEYYRWSTQFGVKLHF